VRKSDTNSYAWNSDTDADAWNTDTDTDGHSHTDRYAYSYAGT
jgi:hypothetical protein